MLGCCHGGIELYRKVQRVFGLSDCRFRAGKPLKVLVNACLHLTKSLYEDILTNGCLMVSKPLYE